MLRCSERGCIVRCKCSQPATRLCFIKQCYNASRTTEVKGLGCCMLDACALSLPHSLRESKQFRCCTHLRRIRQPSWLRMPPHPTASSALSHQLPHRVWKWHQHCQPSAGNGAAAIAGSSNQPRGSPIQITAANPRAENKQHAAATRTCTARRGMRACWTYVLLHVYVHIGLSGPSMPAGYSSLQPCTPHVNTSEALMGRARKRGTSDVSCESTQEATLRQPGRHRPQTAEPSATEA